MTYLKIIACGYCHTTVVDDGHIRWDLDTADLHECRISTPTADAAERFLREGR